MLARESGRPILPVAIATSRFKRLDNWDRSVIHLPSARRHRRRRRHARAARCRQRGHEHCAPSSSGASTR